MPELTRTLIALDIDGALTLLPGDPPFHGRTDSYVSGEFFVEWRPDIIARLHSILSRPYVEPVWFTTWVTNLARIREFEERIDFFDNFGSPLVPFRAMYPIPSQQADLFPDDVSLTPGPRWWKFYAATDLCEWFEPARFAWFDDNLGCAEGPAEHDWQPLETSEFLLLRTNEAEGISHADLDLLESWLETRPDLDEAAHSQATRA